MNAWTFFRRARIILLSFLVMSCLAWTTLLTVFLVHEWSYFSHFQRVVIISLLSLYGFTAILLYLMVVVHFRLWWDMARMFTLLIIHAGGSVAFTLYNPSFPCRGFSTETVCRELVHVIFIGCWAFCGIILCFVVALGIMAFLPRPVESLSGKGETELPPSPASFKAGSIFNEQRPSSLYSIDSRKGLLNYDKSPEEFLSPPHALILANGDSEETGTVGPPPLWQGFQAQNNTPRKPASVLSGPRRADSPYLNPFRDPSPPPTSIHSSAPMTRTGTGGNRSPSLTSRYNSPPSGTTPYGDRAAVSTTTLGDDLQPWQIRSDRAQTAASSLFSFHSATGSIHSTWSAPTPHILPPPVLTPGIVHSRGPNAVLRSQDPSLAYNAPFRALELNASALKRNFSEPSRTVQRYGGRSAHRSYILPVTENPFQQRGSDGEVLGQARWQQLVLNAAANP